MEKGDDAAPPDRLAAGNDNEPGTDLSGFDVDAAPTRIAEAVGRHIAREHIHACKAANDNDPGSVPPPSEP